MTTPRIFQQTIQSFSDFEEEQTPQARGTRRR
jgi:hypothetical protein